MRSSLGPVLMSVLGLSACADFQPTQQLVIPLDERPPVRSEVTPPPISGGTLTVLRDGVTAVAADPDRDRVLVADIAAASVRATIALEPGDEPGRVAEAEDGIVHVVLRGADALVTIDAVEGNLLARRETCAEPRGVAFDPLTHEVHVACASGSLMTFVGGDTPIRTLDLGPDLRDVLLQDGRLLVTRFKTGELLEVDSSGASHVVATPPRVVRQTFTEDGRQETPMTASTAWRAVSTPTSGTLIVHQRGQEEEVELFEPTPQQPSSYGGGGGSSTPGCQGIVESAVTRIGSGSVTTSGALMGVVLPVDVAVSAGGTVAVANAGVRDPEMPEPFVVDHRPETGGDALVAREETRPASGIFITDLSMLTRETEAGSRCAVDFTRIHMPEPVTAVAFTPDGNLLVAQTREPARLRVFDVRTFGPQRVIELGGEPRADTGHDLFHRDTGAGIACASCHPEGGEDGRVWHFADLGPRRTQALHVGLAGTAPFHWDGELEDMNALMREVFVGRMGGVHQSPERLETLSGWLFELDAPAPMVAAGDPAVARGREIFERAECGTCHGGDGFTGPGTFDVGTGGRFQVPSLVGIGYRAPFLHHGCAEDLHQRFDPACGGGGHGAVEALSSAEIDDLVTYLRSL